MKKKLVLALIFTFFYSLSSFSAREKSLDPNSLSTDQLERITHALFICVEDNVGPCDSFSASLDYQARFVLKYMERLEEANLKGFKYDLAKGLYLKLSEESETLFNRLRNFCQTYGEIQDCPRAEASTVDKVILLLKKL